MSMDGDNPLSKELKITSFSGEGNFFERILSDIFKPVVDGAKNITGAKAAEDANKMAREQFDQTAANAAIERQKNIDQVGRDQVQQSQMAGAARASRSSVKLGQDEKDFLGI